EVMMKKYLCMTAFLSLICTTCLITSGCKELTYLIKEEVVVGTTIRNDVYFVVEGDFTATKGSETFSGKVVDLSAFSLEETRVLEVRNGKIAKAEVKKLRDLYKQTFESAGAQEHNSERGILNGVTFIAEKVEEGEWPFKKEKWSFGKKDKKLSKAQLKELNGSWVPPDYGSDFFPDQAIPVGHVWFLSEEEVEYLFESAFDDVTGTGRLELLRITEREGRQCAVIEESYDLRAKMVEEDLDLDMALTLSGETFFDLVARHVVYSDHKGPVEIKGFVLDGGKKMHLTITGKGTLTVKSERR
ncbi:hypothetical protein ACFLU6_10785, partial [Acidobacteriota bacterium]